MLYKNSTFSKQRKRCYLSNGTFITQYCIVVIILVNAKGIICHVTPFNSNNFNNSSTFLPTIRCYVTNNTFCCKSDSKYLFLLLTNVVMWVVAIRVSYLRCHWYVICDSIYHVILACFVLSDKIQTKERMHAYCVVHFKRY